MRALRWLHAPAEQRWPRWVMITLWVSLVGNTIENLIGWFG